MNPLFDDKNTQQDTRKPTGTGYVLPRQSGKILQPLNKKYTTRDTDTADETANPHQNAAIELIRKKLETVYDDEPDVHEEIKEVQAVTVRSKHQQVMYDLTNSGLSATEIQKAWHEYYAGLSDAGKHEVWREFYANNQQQTPAAAAHSKALEKHVANKAAEHQAVIRKEAGKPKAPLQLHPESDKNTQAAVVLLEEKTAPPVPDKNPLKRSHKKRGADAIRKHVVEKVKLSAAQQEKAKHHFHSLLFGISFGVVVLIVFMFSFFNDRIIAPFIQPSRTVSSTPIILNSDSVAATGTPEVIIPKINVQIPVDYNQKSLEEDAIQASLENGVVHYASTSLPGEQGNTAIFGHSSNNIFNKGKYKFAFVKLSELVPGDIFYLTKDTKIYTYRVYDKRIVTPQQTEVLQPVDGKVTATLITCDPPGTSTNRLVVWGEQISPDPASATVAAAPDPALSAEPAQLSSNGPTLWNRLTKWLF